MKLLDVIGKGLKAVGSALNSVARVIADAAAATARFLRQHWAATAAVVLGLIAFAAVTAALVFFWPATIGAIAGLSIALPAIGTVAPFAFLSTLSIPAAAAVIGAFAFGATLAASALVNAFASAYNGLDRFFNPAPKNNRDSDSDNDDEFSEESSVALSVLGQGGNRAENQQRQGPGAAQDHAHHPRPAHQPVPQPVPQPAQQQDHVISLV